MICAHRGAFGCRAAAAAVHAAPRPPLSLQRSTNVPLGFGTGGTVKRPASRLRNNGRRRDGTSALGAVNGSARGAIHAVAATEDLPASAVTTHPDPSTAESKAKDGETFNWFDHWYPIHVLDCMDASRPHHAKLFGRDLVLWKDGNMKWNCMEDMCPHRLAPLSEGRVEADGQLLCAYHGWRFDSTGKCTDLPQAKTPVSEWDPKQIPCTVTYPTLESHGLLFVWPETGPEAEAKAVATKPRGDPERTDGRMAAAGQALNNAWVIRDMPYGWDFAMENLLDPAHFPVSHHKFIGNRYTDSHYFNMAAERTLSVQEGFMYRLDRELIGIPAQTLDFQPPCHVLIAGDHRDGQSYQTVNLFLSPTTPGHCRLFECQSIVAGADGSMEGKMFARVTAVLPKWLRHIASTMFVHQDSVFLHHQEKAVTKRILDNGRRACDGYRMPTPSDKMTIVFRKWFERMSGGIPWAPGTPLELPPAEYDSAKLHDVYHAHSKHCTHCMGAIQGTKLWQAITVGLAVLSTACGIAVHAAHCASLASAAVASGSVAAQPALYAPPGLTIGLGLLAMALVGAAWLCAKLRDKMHIHEFSHADNN